MKTLVLLSFVSPLLAVNLNMLESSVRVTHSAAAVLDSLRGDAGAVRSGRHVEVGWRTRRGFGACTSEARHPEEPSPAQ